MTVLENTESPSLNIDLKELSKVLEKLFAHLIETRGQKQITIEKVFYWDMPFKDLFDMENEPKEFDIGSIADDWEFLSSVLKDDDLVLVSQFEKLSALFRYIGEHLASQLGAAGG